ELDDTQLPALLAGKLRFGPAVPVGEVARRIAEVIKHDDLEQSGGTSVLTPPVVTQGRPLPIRELDGVAVEELAALIQRDGALARAARGDVVPSRLLGGYLRGVGLVRGCLRLGAISEALALDIGSVSRSCATHQQFIHYLREDLDRGGLGIITPAYRIELDRRSKQLQDAREELRRFLEAAVERVEVYDNMS